MKTDTEKTNQNDGKKARSPEEGAGRKKASSAMQDAGVPSWLTSELFQRMGLACQHFSLFRRIVHARKDVIIEHRKRVEEGKEKSKTYEELRTILEERFPLPQFRELKKARRDKGKEALWSQRDIALILGREQSSISRNIQRMRKEEKWVSRLKSAVKKSGDEALYNSNIFPLLIERWEEEYLQRVFKPRRGSQLTWAQEDELRSLWQEMRDIFDEQIADGRERRSKKKPEDASEE